MSLICFMFKYDNLGGISTPWSHFKWTWWQINECKNGCMTWWNNTLVLFASQAIEARMTQFQSLPYVFIQLCILVTLVAWLCKSSLPCELVLLLCLPVLFSWVPTVVIYIYLFIKQTRAMQAFNNQNPHAYFH